MKSLTRLFLILTATAFLGACEGEKVSIPSNSAVAQNVGIQVKSDKLDSLQVIELEKCSAGISDACQVMELVKNCNAGISQACQVIELEKKCNAGASAACHLLGTIHRTADGVQLDELKAFEFYQKGCDGNLFESCAASIAMLKRFPELEDVKLQQKACDSGIALGCSNLGFLFNNSDSVLFNKNKALYFFAKACDMKFEIGCMTHAKLKSQGVR